MRVDQVIPRLARRDAIGVHTLALRDALRLSGLGSDIYYGSCDEDVAGEGRPIAHLGRAASTRRLLYQSSIGSPVFDILAARPEPKLVNYHNITPAALLSSWEPAIGHEASLGRAQLQRLAPATELAVADSAFNERELHDAGYRATDVVPLLIDMTHAGADPDPAVTEQLAERKAAGGADLLFVGKVSPHKASHDLVKLLAAYRRVFDPRARLHLVGGAISARYADALDAFIERLGLERAVRVTGSVSPAELEAYYRAADVFVCASDHEGFCVPLVEAMGHGVPVVAYGSTAVPETVEDAGIVLTNKEPLRFACAVARVVEDADLRARLAAAAARRVEHFSLERSTARFVAAIHRALGA